MEYIKLFIILILLLFFLQYACPLKLEPFQFAEMIFGAFFIILFFGLFGSILTLNPDLLNNSALFASLYAIWFFMVKKLSNSINSDQNGVIRY
jgi:uncharacterized BrkB/YihY/UPF0761 family membrane protein